MSSITALFFEQVKKNPDKTAIWCDGKTKSYSELDTFVSQYINYLVSDLAKQVDAINVLDKFRPHKYIKKNNKR